MSVKPWLEKAGRFDIEHVGGIPHFNQAVDPVAPPTGVLHTTEGSWDGSLSVFKRHYAPHFMVGPNRIAQLVQVGTIGASLVTHNTIPLVQVEMVGFSRETPWAPDDETLEAIAALMAACHAEYGIPPLRPWTDGVFGKAYARDPHRAEGKFGHVAGWYGHGDVPSPDSHWDPGALKWSALFDRAAAMPLSPITSQEEGEEPPPHPCTLARPDLSTAAGLCHALDILGYHAPTLEAAVQRFQTGVGGLAVDGIAGVLTRSALATALAKLG
jgi:hypothetical protein